MSNNNKKPQIPEPQPPKFTTRKECNSSAIVAMLMVEVMIGVGLIVFMLCSAFTL